MSWLPRSRSLALNPDDSSSFSSYSSAAAAAAAADDDDGETSPPNRGVKEDLSELTETLTRQFWSAASFLAPPPPPPPASPPPPVPSCAIRPLRRPPGAGPGIRSDFVEIGGRFRSGISKIASNFLAGVSDTEGEEEEEEDGDEEGDGEETYSVRAVGLTDEVLAFARNISMHPETWLDFPLYYDFEDCQDFDMSDAQQDHALAVEHLLPRLAALRIELCPNHMTDGCFWKIYFVLLHSRLNKHDAELLSTRHIVEAKSMLLQRLQSQMKEESENASRSYNNAYESLDTPEANFDWEFRSGKTLAADRIPHFNPSTDYVMEKDRLAATETVNIIDKRFVAEEPSTSLGISVQNYVDDHEGDAWLEEQSRALHDSGAPSIHLIDEDVSFSDLEDDDDCSMPAGYKAMIQLSSSQTRDARECSPLNKSTNYTHTKNIGTNNLLDPDDEFDTFMGQ